MSVPEWAKEEQSIDEAKNYLRQGNAVDFFELMCSHILREHPVDMATFCLERVQSIADEKEVSTENDFYPKALEDNKYVRENNVCDFLNDWILALLSERPSSDDDRIEFHKRYLESIIAAKSEAADAKVEDQNDDKPEENNDKTE